MCWKNENFRNTGNIAIVYRYLPKIATEVVTQKVLCFSFQALTIVIVIITTFRCISTGVSIRSVSIVVL